MKTIEHFNLFTIFKFTHTHWTLLLLLLFLPSTSTLLFKLVHREIFYVFLANTTIVGGIIVRVNLELAIQHILKQLVKEDNALMFRIAPIQIWGVRRHTLEHLEQVHEWVVSEVVSHHQLRERVQSVFVLFAGLVLFAALGRLWLSPVVHNCLPRSVW